MNINDVKHAERIANAHDISMFPDDQKPTNPNFDSSLFDFVPLQYNTEEVTHPPRIDFVLPGLELGSIGAIVSPGGAGKSMFALQLATQLASGTTISDLLGLGELKRRLVVYLPAEDSREIVANRMHAISRHYEVHELSAVNRNLIVGPLIGKNMNIFDPNWISFLDRFAAASELIILDTLRKWHVEDENNGGKMSELLSRLEFLAQKHKTSFIFLHHSSKHTALNGQGDAQQASRGSSVLVDNIRWQINLVGMSEKEAEKYGVPTDRRRDYVRMVHSKSNYGAPMPDTWFKRQEGGVLKRVVLDSRNNGGVRDVSSIVK